MADILSVLIWVQTVWNGYQQTTAKIEFMLSCLLPSEDIQSMVTFVCVSFKLIKPIVILLFFGLEQFPFAL